MTPAKQSASNEPSTKERILQVATRMMQQRGFHGFTFQEVAKELGVSHVAVHHHYKTKGALGAAALAAYTDHFVTELEAITATGGEPLQQLRAYANLFEAVVDRSGRICLCATLAAEIATLPTEIQPEVVRFYDANERWLASVIGAATGQDPAEDRVARQAAAFLSLLGGAMIGARTFGDPARLSSAASLWIDGLEAP